jgi:hypothetical protein
MEGGGAQRLENKPFSRKINALWKAVEVGGGGIGGQGGN